MYVCSVIAMQLLFKRLTAMKTNPTFKFEKQNIDNNLVFNVKPEQVIMLQLQNAMKSLKIRSFKTYLTTYTQTTRVQRVSISIAEIGRLLGVDNYTADALAVKWMNEIGGNVVYSADIAAYYFNGVYEITN